jgi:thiosulfate reductase cytochrome b subunit
MLEAAEEKRGETVAGPTTVDYRHPLPVRLFHWVNVFCFVILLMSGLQIFNSYPRLYWGNVGHIGMPAVFEITGNATSDRNLSDRKSWMQIGHYRINTTGVLGKPVDAPFLGVINWAFPSWMTLPSGVLELGRGRGWHFLMIWIFVVNLCCFLVYAVIGGRLWREYLPRRGQLQPRAVLNDIWRHLCLRRARGEEARHYNLLQKLSYLVVVCVFMPVQVLTGMAMSHSAVAIYPWILRLFGGFQTARTLHFLIAWLLVFFVLVHIFQAFVAGIVNELRSMITGYYIVPTKESKR